MWSHKVAQNQWQVPASSTSYSPSPGGQPQPQPRQQASLRSDSSLLDFPLSARSPVWSRSTVQKHGPPGRKAADRWPGSGWEHWELESLQHLYIDLSLSADDIAVLLRREFSNVQGMIRQRQRAGLLGRKAGRGKLRSIPVRVEAILDYNRRRGCLWAEICKLPGVWSEFRMRSSHQCFLTYDERRYLSGWRSEDDVHLAKLAWRDFESAWKSHLQEVLGRKYTKYECERRLILLRSNPVGEQNIAPAPSALS